MPTTQITPPGLSSVERMMRSVPYPCARAFSPRPLVTLMYHAVSDRDLPHVRPIYDYKSTAAFDADLQAIRDRYDPVSHEDVRRYREDGVRLPPRALSVTFDDGFRECLTEARPLLRRHDIPCTFFVVGDLIDNKSLMYRNEVALALDAIEKLPEPELAVVLPRFADLGLRAESRRLLAGAVTALTYPERDRVAAASEILGIDVDGFLRDARPYLTAEEIVGLHREGFTIGAHTLDHPELWLLDDFDAVARQIVESCARVRDLTGQERVPFAFPFNGRAIDRDALEKLRRDNPFVCLMYDTNNLMRDRPFVVNRVDADIVRGSGPDRSNVPFLLNRAHLLEPLRRIKRWKGG